MNLPSNTTRLTEWPNTVTEKQSWPASKYCANNRK